MIGMKGSRTARIRIDHRSNTNNIPNNDLSSSTASTSSTSGSLLQQQQRQKVGRSLQGGVLDVPPALASIVAQIHNRTQLDTLFLTSETSAGDTSTIFSRAAVALRETTTTTCAGGGTTTTGCTKYSFRGRGINLFEPFFSPSNGWIGKNITGTKTGTDGTSTLLELLNNYANGDQQSPALLSFQSYKVALGTPFNWVFVLGWPFQPLITLDDKSTLVVDYRARSFFAPAVDGMRPVTRTGLDQAGIVVTEDITDVWVGFLVYNVLGVFNLFSHYFVVQFDPETIIFS